MKFEKGKGSEFYMGLNAKIDAYFNHHQKNKFATTAIFIKGGILLCIYLACYVLIYVFPGKLSILIPSYILLGLTGVMIVFNLVHDASHHAISAKKSVNNYVRYIGDMVGINTYIWDIRHNIQHHSFTNVLGGDLIIENIPLIRLSQHQPYRKYHVYQPYYAIILYLLYSFYWMFVIDIRLFFKKEICNLKNIKHPRKEWIQLILFKTFYIMYMLVLPVLFTDMSLTVVIALFMLMHCAAGLLLSTVAVLGHFVEGPSFPEPVNGVIANSWSEHELEATIDFAPSSRIINWITGGLNTHVAHHLYPQICHIHYYQMTRIIEEHCNKNGYPYKKESFFNALASHFRYLKKLSLPNQKNDVI